MDAFGMGMNAEIFAQNIMKNAGTRNVNGIFNTI